MNAHLFIIHFPIVATLLAALADAVGAGTDNTALRIRAGQLLMIGGVAAFLSFGTGESAMLAAVNSGEVDLPSLAAHEQWGSVGTWALLGAAMARGVWRHRFDGAMGWVNLIIALVVAGLAIGITVSGTLVRHGM